MTSISAATTAGAEFRMPSPVIAFPVSFAVGIHRVAPSRRLHQKGVSPSSMMWLFLFWARNGRTRSVKPSSNKNLQTIYVFINIVNLVVVVVVVNVGTAGKKICATNGQFLFHRASLVVGAVANICVMYLPTFTYNKIARASRVDFREW